MRARLIGLTILLALGAGTPALAQGSHSLGAVALRRGDVPGLRMAVSQPISMQAAARNDHISVRELEKHGRKSAYKSVFVARKKTGIYRVEDVVAHYRSAAGARWDYSRVVNDALRRQAVRRYPGFRLFHVRGVGAFNAGFSYLVGRGRSQSRIDVVRFEKGTDRVSIEVRAVAAGTARAKEDRLAVTLAQRVAHRIHK